MQSLLFLKCFLPAISAEGNSLLLMAWPHPLGRGGVLTKEIEMLSAPRPTDAAPLDNAAPGLPFGFHLLLLLPACLLPADLLEIMPSERIFRRARH